MPIVLRPDEVVTLSLRIGSKGPEVTLIHSCLLLLRQRSNPESDSGRTDIAPSAELATATYGPGTRLAVLEFQRNNAIELAGQPSGMVDQETFTVTRTKLHQAGIQWERSSELFVAGTVKYADGSPGAKLSITVRDKDFGAEDRLLVDAVVDVNGCFVGRYFRDKIHRPESGRNPTLVTEVSQDGRILHASDLQDAIYDAPVLSIIAISISQASVPTLPTNEFSRIASALKSALPTENLDSATLDMPFAAARPSQIPRRLRDHIAEIDPEQSDIELLTRLKPKELSQAKVSATILASRLSQAAAEHEVEIEPEVFYALLATDTQRNYLSRQPANIALSTVSLQTPSNELLFQLGMLDPSVIASALERAKDIGVISPAWDLSRIRENWEKIRDIGRHWAQEQPTTEDYVWSLIEEYLSSGKEKAVRGVLAGEDYEGDVMGFIRTLGAALSTQPLDAPIRPMRFPQTNLPGRLLSRNRLLKSLEGSHEMRTLSMFDRETLASLVTQASGSQDDDSLAADELQAVTNDLHGILEKTFPTNVFKTKLDEHMRQSLRDASGSSGRDTGGGDAAALSSQQPGQILLGQRNLAIDGSAVQRFLEANPSFDMRLATLPTAASSTDGEREQLRQVAAVQRLFKLAPTFEKTRALLDCGVVSAGQIASMSRSQFAREFAGSTTLTPSEADDIFDRASNVRLAAALLAADLRTTANAMLLSGPSDPLPSAKLEALTKDFPDVAALFSWEDVCACDDCMTVYSPAAYLVDVLEFLRYRQLLDSADGPRSGLTARDVLLGRRPDLANLDLSCDNTKTTLPYLDLVCELLEDFVAPDGLSPGSFVGDIRRGKIESILLDFLRDDLRLPISEEAIVSDEFNGGYRTVRDTGGVVLLGPRADPEATAPDQRPSHAVRVLRQTYGDSEALAARPAYVNDVAYRRLREAVFMPSLPYDLELQECRGYLLQLGTPRANLIRELTIPSSDFGLALERLSLTAVDGLLITTGDLDNQRRYWNIAEDKDPAEVLKQVSVFIAASKILYGDLLAMMNATSWLNAAESTATDPPPARMFIKSERNTCSLRDKSIQELSSARLDRLHRFIRLWKAIATTDSGWRVSNLDRALAAAKLGAGKLDVRAVTDLLAISDLASQLSRNVPTTIDDVIDLFDVLRTATDPTAPSAVTYASVFLNDVANGPGDSRLELRNVPLDASSSASPVAVPLETKATYLSTCLGVTPEDFELLVSEVVSMNGDANLTLTNLSTIYAVTSVCNRLALTMRDFSLFKKLTGQDPLLSLSNMQTFSSTVADMGGLMLSASECQLITLPPSAETAAIDVSAPRVDQFLDSLQDRYHLIGADNLSPFDEELSPDENTTSALALISRVSSPDSEGEARSMTQATLAQFQGLLDGQLQPSVAASLVRERLQPTVGREASEAIVQAHADLAASMPPEQSARRMALNKAILDALSASFATAQRKDALLEELAGQFGFTAELAGVLLTLVPALQPLLDGRMSSGPMSASAYPEALRAIRLIHRLDLVSRKLGLPTARFAWLLRASPALGWADLTTLPTAAGDAAVPWPSWTATTDYVLLVRSDELPDVQDRSSRDGRYSVEGFLDLVAQSIAASNPQVAVLEPYICALTGHQPSAVSALVGSLGLTVAKFSRVSALRRLNSAANLIRKANMPADAAIKLGGQQGLTADDTAVARNALKRRYGEESSWLETLKLIQNKLRLQKRDALVAYLLAINKPNIASSRDLSELILMDVDMGTATTTSRIIQAHLSVQQFVQRLLMGLEPTPIVVDDPDWTRWPSMSQYRVWEASKKVLLYTENWIEPDLRMGKSEIYVKIEEELQKQPLTDTSVETAIAGYLRSLDDIAYLEVFTCFYDVPTKMFHVFARSKGGTPRQYYHRTQFAESVWSPWERMDGVNVPGDIATSFLRNDRLTLAWPILNHEQDPSQTTNPAPYPDVMNLTNNDGTQSSPDPPRKRLAIQLGLTERNKDTGKWSAPLITEGAVYWPQNGVYTTSDQFIENSETMLSLHYWDLGAGLGENIVLCANLNGGRETQQPAAAMFGAFSMTGCKGFPVPFDSGFKRSTSLPFSPRPAFKSTNLLSGRFSKTRSIPSNSAAELAIMGMLDGNMFSTILGAEKGRFMVTYPSQPTEIDRFFVALQLWSMAQARASSSTSPSLMAVEQSSQLIIPQGSYLPYFVTDSSTRSYAITPGYVSAQADDAAVRTTSAVFDFFEKAKNLALRYISIYYGVAGRDISEVRKQLELDVDYQRLKDEWLNVYVDASDPRAVSLRPAVAQITNFYHPLVCFLRSRLYSDGVDGLLARKTQLHTSELDFSATYRPTDRIRAPLPIEDLDFSLAGASSSYNFDLFLFLPWEISNMFRADGQWEKAQRFLQYIYNPSGAGVEAPDASSAEAPAPQRKYWQTKPFYRMQPSDYAHQRIDSILSSIAGDPGGFSLANDIQTQIKLWRSNPFDASTIAKARPVTYQISVVMRYIQNLMDWGDSLFRRLTRESINQASVLYMTADKLLGAKPQTVEPVVKAPVRTYNELRNSIDLVGNAMLDLENLIPDLSVLSHGGQELPLPGPTAPPDVPPLTSLYFCVPPNDKLLQMWDLVADRLFKIRNSMDMDGNFISLALTAPPIDPGALIKALASGASLSDILTGLDAPLPHYRFQYVFEQALAITQDVIDLGQQLLSVLEKRDAEELARLRANGEITVLSAVRNVKLAAIDQNISAGKALTASKAMATTRDVYYQNLIDVGNLELEDNTLTKNDDAAKVDSEMALNHRDAAYSHYWPTASVGTGAPWTVNLSVSYGGGNVGSAKTSDIAARAAERSIIATDAITFATKASFARRKREWEFQKQLAVNELAYIDAQIVSSQATGTMLNDDLTAHDATTSESTSARNYLQSKYTNTELYQWAVSRVSRTHSQAYQLAFSMAKKAERCMAFELGDFSDGGTLIGFGSWDSLRSGLLAGNDLRMGLRRLQTAYMDRNKRELELTKSVSLAQVAPEALLDLRTTGSCIFSLPESLFDLDYPGHYFRRTKSIAIHILCRIAPWSSVSATLRLVSSRYRARPTGATAAMYAENEPGADPRFVYNVVPPPAVTGSATAANDAGVFEVSLRGDDPRYLPFEYSGVLGTYTLSLPPVQQFEYASIGDAVLHLSYTARDGGSKLREAAMPVPKNGVTSISLRSAFQADWNALKAGRQAQPVLVSGAQLPFWATAQGRTVQVQETTWCVMAEEGLRLDDSKLVVASTELVLELDASGKMWKATLPADKVVFGEPVPLAWTGPAVMDKTREIICVVHYNIATSPR